MSTPRLLLALLLSTGLVGGAQGQLWPIDPAPRRELPPAQLGTLVQLLSVEDPLLRWDLAAVALDALVDTYQGSLDIAARDHPGKAAARRKLWRWQRATGDLVAHLVAMREALETGASFDVFVDGVGQILVVVDQQLIIVSGYDHDSDSRLRGRILNQFCEYNDCWWLGMRAPDTQP